MTIKLTPADDYLAVIDNAPPYSDFLLEPGLYLITSPIRPPDFSTFSGAGTSTILRNEQSGAVIENLMTSYGRVLVEDMTIDCNGQSFLGINLYGSHNTVRRVTVRNHINPSAEQEAFGILLTNSTDGNWQPCCGNLVEDCTIRDFQGFYNGGIVIAGPAAMDGTIRRCNYLGSTPSVPEVGPGVGCFGATLVEDCFMDGVATGVYTEGLNNRSTPAMTVRNCRFENIRSNAIRINLIRDQRDLAVEGCSFHMANQHGIAIEALQNALQLDSITVRGCTVAGDHCRLLRAPGVRHKALENNTDLSR